MLTPLVTKKTTFEELESLCNRFGVRMELHEAETGCSVRLHSTVFPGILYVEEGMLSLPELLDEAFRKLTWLGVDAEVADVRAGHTRDKITPV